VRVFPVRRMMAQRLETVRQAQACPAASDSLGYAVVFIEHGMPVFPVRPRSKEPLTAHGFKDATHEPATVQKWLNRWPDMNLGVATGKGSGIAVLDVDGEDAEEKLGELSRVTDDISWQDTWISATGRPGGAHFWFRWTPDVPRTGAARLGEHLDIRSDNAYVVAPPSDHPNGTTYTFIGEQRKLQPWPSWLKPTEPEDLRTTERPRTVRPRVMGRGDRCAAAALEGEAERVRTASVGTRNDTLNRAAFAVARFLPGQLSAREAAATLLAAALAAGLDEREACRTIASAFQGRGA